MISHYRIKILSRITRIVEDMHKVCNSYLVACEMRFKSVAREQIPHHRREAFACPSSLPDFHQDQLGQPDL